MVVLMNMATGEREILNETPEQAWWDGQHIVEARLESVVAQRALAAPSWCLDEPVEAFLTRMESMAAIRHSGPDLA